MDELSLTQAGDIVGSMELSLATDLGLLLVIALVLLVITLWRGTSYAASLTLALYPSLIIVPRILELFPTVHPLSLFGLPPVSEQAVLFVGLFVLATYAIHRFIERVELPTGPWHYIQAVLIACVSGGALFAAVYHSLGTHTLFKHSTFIDLWFVNDTAFLVWLVAPLVALLIITRR